MSSLPPIGIDPKTFLRQHCSLPALPRTLTLDRFCVITDGFLKRSGMPVNSIDGVIWIELKQEIPPVLSSG